MYGKIQPICGENHQQNFKNCEGINLNWNFNLDIIYNYQIILSFNLLVKLFKLPWQQSYKKFWALFTYTFGINSVSRISLFYRYPVDYSGQVLIPTWHTRSPLIENINSVIVKGIFLQNSELNSSANFGWYNFDTVKNQGTFFYNISTMGESNLANWKKL